MKPVIRWPAVKPYGAGPRAPSSGYASHLQCLCAAAMALAALPAVARPMFRVEATLLIPHHSGKPLTRDLGVTLLHADSLAQCELVHARRISAEKAQAADVKRSGGLVVAECKPAGEMT